MSAYLSCNTLTRNQTHRYTTGCIIIAKSDLAHWRLAEDFAQHRIDKRYLAIVCILLLYVSCYIACRSAPFASRSLPLPLSLRVGQSQVSV
jgi:hypothetical protein